MESEGYSLVVVQGLLIWEALEHRLNSCGTQAYLFHGMCNLPGSGIKPVSLALAGEFFTTEPQGSPIVLISKFRTIVIIAVEN